MKSVMDDFPQGTGQRADPCPHGELLEHRVEALERRTDTHGREIDDIRLILAKLTTLEDQAQKRAAQLTGAVASVAVAVAGAAVLAFIGLG